MNQRIIRNPSLKTLVINETEITIDSADLLIDFLNFPLDGVLACTRMLSNALQASDLNLKQLIAETNGALSHLPDGWIKDAIMAFSIPASKEYCDDRLEEVLYSASERARIYKAIDNGILLQNNPEYCTRDMLLRHESNSPIAINYWLSILSGKIIYDSILENLLKDVEGTLISIAREHLFSMLRCCVVIQKCHDVFTESILAASPTEEMCESTQELAEMVGSRLPRYRIEDHTSICASFAELLLLEYDYLRNAGIKIRKCLNCGTLFSCDSSRVRFCSGFDHNGKPCREEGPQNIRKERLENDEVAKEADKHRKSLSKWKLENMNNVETYQLEDDNVDPQQVIQAIKDYYTGWMNHRDVVLQAYYAGMISEAEAKARLKPEKANARVPLLQKWRQSKRGKDGIV